MQRFTSLLLATLASLCLARAVAVSTEAQPPRLLPVSNDCYGNGEYACFNPNQLVCPGASCGTCKKGHWTDPLTGAEFYYCACDGATAVDPRDPANDWDCGLYLEVNFGALVDAYCRGNCAEPKVCTRLDALDPSGQGRTCYTCKCVTET